MAISSRDSSRLRVSQLNRRSGAAVDVAPDAAARAALADSLGLLDLPAARLVGRLTPEGGEGWRLAARLEADVVQPCVVTLAPVAAHLEEEVTRVFSPHVTAPDAGGETEMGDDEVEPLGQTIDLTAVLAEALSLALPLYPRAPGAALDAAEPAPAEDRRRPFAALGDMLKNRES